MPAYGSVSLANEYQATSTFARLGGTSSNYAPAAATTQIHMIVGTGSNILGSIIVASSSATRIDIWNATSTTDVASTSLAHIVASPANGTYTFDSIAPRGLIVDMPTGFNGAYYITYRGQ